MSKDSERYLQYLNSERKAARLYDALAELTDGDRREALLELAEIERRHAAHWIDLLERAGVEIPPDDETLDPDDKEVLQRAQQYSLDSVLTDLEEAEREAESVYDSEPDAPRNMSVDERQHAKVLRKLASQASAADLAATVATQKMEANRPFDAQAILANSENWHHVDKSGTARAAVFGISDGLVSNTALVMGFAGGGIGSSTVLFAGIAGLLAGAFSMAAGEYVSVAGQRDLFEKEIAIEAEELRTAPQEEERELELIYRAKGLDADLAKQVAKRIMSDPEVALDTMVREELGLDPDELGSPIKVAASSFASFAVGAIVPVIPYLFLSGSAALTLGIVLAVIALLVVGGTVGRISGSGTVKSALRQLAFGGGAAIVTYVIGHFIGIGLG